MVFVDSFYFNRIKYLVFNSTVGEYVGYNEVGQKTAEAFNNDKAHLAIMQNYVHNDCNLVGHMYKAWFMNLTCKYTSTPTPRNTHTLKCTTKTAFRRTHLLK